MQVMSQNSILIGLYIFIHHSLHIYTWLYLLCGVKQMQNKSRFFWLWCPTESHLMFPVCKKLMALYLLYLLRICMILKLNASTVCQYAVTSQYIKLYPLTVSPDKWLQVKVNDGTAAGILYVLFSSLYVDHLRPIYQLYSISFST